MTCSSVCLTFAILIAASGSIAHASDQDFHVSSFWEAKIHNKTATTTKHEVLKNITTKPKLSLIQTALGDEDSPLADEGDVGTDASQPGASPIKFLASAQPGDQVSTGSDSGAPETLAKAMAAMNDVPSGSPSTPQSRAATMAAMEATLMNLLNGNNAFGATPMGGSVKKIVTIIEQEMKPAIAAAHKSDQNMLHQLISDLLQCKAVKDSSTLTASPWNTKYKQQSKEHQKCRMDEAVQYSSKETCLSQQRALYQVKQLKCKAYSAISAEYGSTTNNQAIVDKAGSESVENYLFRLSRTICGKHVHGTNGRKKATGGWGGGLEKGMLDNFLRHKHACEVATKEYNTKVKECKRKIRLYNNKKAQCNGFQAAMDSQSCKYAVMMKDTCEQYAGCYIPKKKEFKEFAANTRLMERDRKAEWRGVTRMHCIISAFSDGQVSDKEVDACKKATVTTTHLIIKYPAIPPRAPCIVSKLYPSTGSYKRREFVPLPVLAKG